jgi:hypothetical protein
VGFLVAGGWGVYFALANKDNPINPIVNTLSRVTCPAGMASLHFHFPISVYWVLIVNAATYALVGVIVETLRQKPRHAT